MTIAGQNKDKSTPQKFQVHELHPLQSKMAKTNMKICDSTDDLVNWLKE